MDLLKPSKLIFENESLGRQIQVRNQSNNIKKTKKQKQNKTRIIWTRHNGYPGRFYNRLSGIVGEGLIRHRWVIWR